MQWKGYQILSFSLTNSKCPFNVCKCNMYIDLKTHVPSNLNAKVKAVSPLLLNAPPFILCFFYPWTFHLYPSYPALLLCAPMGFTDMCLSMHAPRSFALLYVNTWLFGINFPLSEALKASVCLLRAKPRRERCVGAHRLSRPWTTPHRNVWNYTQQGLAHPCLLSLTLPVCHSFTAWA